MMKLEQDMAAVGAELQAFHDKTGTSIEAGIYISDGEAIYRVWIATEEDIRHEFTTAQVLVDWMRDVNADIDPFGSAMARKRLETLRVEQIRRDAEVAALEIQIGEMPETQVVKNAQAEAQAIIAAAAANKAFLEKACAKIEEEAARVSKEASDALAAAKPEELAKMAELQRAAAEGVDPQEGKG
jgi:hypothetical protein